VVGAFSTGPVFMGVFALSALLGLIASPFTDSEFAGPVAMLILAAVGFVAVVVWLVVDAIWTSLRSAAGTRGSMRCDCCPP
jgi:hypothetical protein